MGRIANFIRKLYYTSSSARYIDYLRKKGIAVGGGTIVLDPRHIQIDVSRPELLEIGEKVFLHKGTVIMTHDWASWCFVNKYNDFIPSHAKVRIGNNVWLGENVSILKGVTIGDNVIIGMGSIVTKSIPPDSVAVGCPARVICTIEEYYLKRKKEYLAECMEFAREIMARGREPRPEDFYDDYPAFVDGANMNEYSYPYRNIFNEEQLSVWKKEHKAVFNGFDDFMKHV